ncbi:MAG TPA: hypothetical protein VFQ77_09510 [Pseudonocardiaceae bacterium]|nr:hypothetical protein [Pseudonocardiaceae bacterium]
MDGRSRTLNLALYLPALAVTEFRVVRPDAGSPLAELLGHPSVLVSELDAAAAAQVNRLLLGARVFDALAGQVVYTAKQRGWPALSADPGRLRRVDPTLDIQQI